MKLPSLLVLAAALATFASPLRADEVLGDLQNFTTLAGRHYSGCQVLKVEPDGVTFHHSRGLAKVLFVDMKPELRAQFGYNVDKAVAYERKMHDNYLHARAVEARRHWRESEAAYVNEGGFAMPFGNEGYYPAAPWYGGGEFVPDYGAGFGANGFRFFQHGGRGLIDSSGRLVNENHGAVTVPSYGQVQPVFQRPARAAVLRAHPGRLFE